jgi:hypothetical protein
VSKRKMFENIPLHAQKLNYETNIYELHDHVVEKGLSSNLLLKNFFP